MATQDPNGDTSIQETTTTNCLWFQTERQSKAQDPHKEAWVQRFKGN